MIPVAGDALTEEIARHCLVDFSTAEQIKRDAGEMDTVSFTDIMLLPQTISSKEVKMVVAGLIDDMAKQAAEKIKELNGDKPVSAVFVVGGGGKMPGYTDAIADKLEIARERVALRGEEVMQQIIFEEEVKKDSLLVTPIGICLNFYEQSNNFIFVNFNDSRIKIYDNNKLSVADAAMQAQFPNDGLFPKRGRAVTFTVNGKQRMARGELGEAAIIIVNGERGDINTPIHANDIIKVIESTAGEPAHMTLGALPETGESLTVYVNDKKVKVPRFTSVNGVLKSNYYEIQDQDVIEILSYYTVKQLTEFLDVIIDPYMNLYVNNKLADMDTPVYENFSVVWTMENYASLMSDTYNESGEAEKEKSGKEINAQNQNDGYNAGKDIGGQKEEGIHQSNQAADAENTIIQIIVNKRPITLSGKSDYVYVDIFDVIDFDLSRTRGKGIVATLNGRPAQYLEPIHSGDVMEIYWRN